jgi:phosphodiesterase/alkaline phosphatase D-like protein
LLGGVLGAAPPALAAAPVVVSESSSAVTPFAATLEAQVNPEGQATTSCVFEYGETTAYGSSVECEPALLEDSTEQLTSASITGLKEATTYHYRVVVENAAGETKGTDAEFTTPAAEPPIVGEQSVVGVSSTSAELRARVNPNNQETTYVFEYATNEALTGATTVPGTTPFEAEFRVRVAHVELSELQPGQIYYYRVLATNSTGTSEGPIQSFQTQGPPSAATSEALNLTRTSATLTGSVNPDGIDTTFHFAYVSAADYESLAVNPYAKGATTPESGSVGTSHTDHPVAVLAGELKPGETYHYIVTATSPLGKAIGTDHVFTTAAATPPLATTGDAVNISQISATITGTIDTRGLQSTLRFEFGTTPGAGSPKPARISSEAGSTVGITASFQNSLQPGTTYYYRAVAVTQDGTSYGIERSFTTPSFPEAFAPSTTAALIPYTSIAALDAKEAQEGSKKGPSSRSLTRAQRLAAALKACHKKHNHAKRATCERQARRQYRAAKQAKKAKKT